jgi:hypothetical protein
MSACFKSFVMLPTFGEFELKMEPWRGRMSKIFVPIPFTWIPRERGLGKPVPSGGPET